MSSAQDRGVLFVDIADSSRYYRELGDDAARRLVSQFLLHLADLVTSNGGRVVDQIGDELMCSFDDPQSMMIAAKSLQQAASHAVSGSETVLNVRIGVHFGPVTEENGRLFGATVYTAKRVATLAKARQILVTAETAALVAKDGAVPLRLVDRVALRGFTKRRELYEAVWDPVLQTTQRLDPQDAGRWDVEVALHHLSRDIVLHEGASTASIGRGPTSDVVIDDRDVSWLHARITCDKGRVRLTDMSTNGTFVTFADADPPELIHRDVIDLTGAGLVGCGREPRAGDVTSIAFSCRVVRKSPEPA